MSAAFEAVGLRRVHGDGESRLVALAGVDLTIDEGELVAIVGPSGSGKSTLLSIWGGLDLGYEGRAGAFGNDLRSLGEAELARLRNEKIGFVFQAFHLVPHVSVLDNVLLPSLFARAPVAESRGLEVLERVGLRARAHDLPTQLSGGQRQRVAVARALLLSPPALLCDEPTGNLDSATGNELIDLLASLHRDDGKTVVVVTHDERLSSRAERRVRIRDGHIEGEA